GDEEDLPARCIAADKLLDQVRLPVERVGVVARLFGEAEAEEVGCEGAVLALPLEERLPVVRARREPVEEEQQRFTAVASKQVDAAAAELLLAAAVAPGRDPRGQIRCRHRNRATCTCIGDFGAVTPRRGRPGA